MYYNSFQERNMILSKSIWVQFPLLTADSAQPRIGQILSLPCHALSTSSVTDNIVHVTTLAAVPIQSNALCSVIILYIEYNINCFG